MLISVEGRGRDLAPVSEYGSTVLSQGTVLARRIADKLWAFHQRTGAVIFLLEGDDFCLT